MDNANPTHLILDLRDRMARIETKLDGHHEAHNNIDKCFDAVDKRLVSLEDRQTAQSLLVAETKSEIALSKARVATLAAVGSGLIAIATFLADHLWSLLKVNT